MEIYTNDNDLRKVIEDGAYCKRRHGVGMAKKLMLRVAALRAAVSLADFWPPKSGPERCHELKGDRHGTFSIDLKQPYRLLFREYDVTPQIRRSDEQARWESITAVEILSIEDTHE